MNTRVPTLPVIINEVLEILNNSGGTIKDRDLYEMLRRKYDITYSDFLRYLMVMEIRGFIVVAMPKEDSRVISLVKRK